jgi:excisionase family DNA binding protein
MKQDMSQAEVSRMMAADRRMNDTLRAEAIKKAGRVRQPMASLATPPKNCLSVNQAAEHLGVRPLTVRKLIQHGKLKAFRVGRRVLITWAAIAAYQEANPA